MRAQRVQVRQGWWLGLQDVLSSKGTDGRQAASIARACAGVAMQLCTEQLPECDAACRPRRQRGGAERQATGAAGQHCIDILEGGASRPQEPADRD